MTHEEVRAINDSQERPVKITRKNKTMDEEIQPVEEAVPAVEEEVSAPSTEETAEEVI